MVIDLEQVAGIVFFNIHAPSAYDGRARRGELQQVVGSREEDEAVATGGGDGGILVVLDVQRAPRIRGCDRGLNHRVVGGENVLRDLKVGMARGIAVVVIARLAGGCQGAVARLQHVGA